MLLILHYRLILTALRIAYYRAAEQQMGKLHADLPFVVWKLRKLRDRYKDIAQRIERVYDSIRQSGDF